jgi:hypothetical protein
MDRIEFFADNKTLVIELALDEWFIYGTIYLRNDNDLIKLGSEAFDKIREKFIKQLTTPQDTSLYGGVAVYSIMNLGEPHAAIGASPTNDSGVVLYLLDFDLNFYPIMKLTKDDIDRLVATLRYYPLKFFSADSTKLTIEFADTGVVWATLRVQDKERTVRLGSENIRVVREKFMEGLRLPHKTESRNGVDVYSIMDLCDPPARIMAAPTNDEGIVLYLLEGNGDFYPVMNLTATDIFRLRNEFRDFPV